MLKRILAWISLAGFVLLLLNIMIFHVYIIPSIIVYLIIAVWFLFSKKPYTGKGTKVVHEQPEQDSEADVEKNQEN
jgi:hypothetical protein